MSLSRGQRLLTPCDSCFFTKPEHCPWSHRGSPDEVELVAIVSSSHVSEGNLRDVAAEIWPITGDLLHSWLSFCLIMIFFFFYKLAWRFGSEQSEMTHLRSVLSHNNLWIHKLERLTVKVHCLRFTTTTAHSFFFVFLFLPHKMWE